MGRNLASGDEGCSIRKDRWEWIKMSFGKSSIIEGKVIYESLWKKYLKMRKVRRSGKEERCRKKYVGDDI